MEQTFLSRLTYDDGEGEGQDQTRKFKLYQRARHVFEEASRVQEFRRICQSTTANRSPNDDHHKTIDNLINRLGQLMNESHESCRDLYECSHPKLNQLVDIALNQGGAIGSRLTGAGWGGCTVSLVPESGAEQFESILGKHCKFLVQSGPSKGAVIYQLEQY